MNDMNLNDQIIKCLVENLHKIQGYEFPWKQEGVDVYDSNGRKVVRAPNEEVAGAVVFCGEVLSDFLYGAGVHEIAWKSEKPGFDMSLRYNLNGTFGVCTVRDCPPVDYGTHLAYDDVIGVDRFNYLKTSDLNDQGVI